MSDSETCFSCGYVSNKVEAKGIWHCPNALCKGCGGAWFRYKLDSYEECDDSNTHTVDEEEWLTKGKIYNKFNNIDKDAFYRVPKKRKKDD